MMSFVFGRAKVIRGRRCFGPVSIICERRRRKLFLSIINMVISNGEELRISRASFTIAQKENNVVKLLKAMSRSEEGGNDW